MRSLAVLFGLLLNGATSACEQPSTPDFPADEPIAGRVEKKLNRDVARYIADVSKYLGCLRTDYASDPSRVAKEDAAVADMTRLIDLYEDRVGPNDALIAEISRTVDRQTGGSISKSARKAQQESSIRAATRIYESDAVWTLNKAIDAHNAHRYAETRAAIGELDFDKLSPYERSKAEQVLFTVAYKEENYAEAREHVQKAIAAGGLSPAESFQARIAIVDIDIMLKLSQVDSELPSDRDVHDD